MNLETFTNTTKEIFVEGNKVQVTVHQWHNLEGCNVMMTDEHLNLRLTAALRWEELDVLMIGLQAARSV